MASKQVRMVNIPRSNTNQFYRYKMPELEAKVESRGNGIKTVIVNLSDIAKALARPTTCLFPYTLVFFFFSLSHSKRMCIAVDRPVPVHWVHAWCAGGHERGGEPVHCERQALCGGPEPAAGRVY